MGNSSYKVVLASDATSGSTGYLQHYGIKGMKWGVVHDEDEKRRTQSQPYVSPEYQAEVAYNSRKNTTTNVLPAQKSRSSSPVNVSRASPEYQAEVAYNSQKNEFSEAARGVSAGIADQLRDPETREGIKTVLEADELHEATSELIDVMKEVTLDKIEKQNPTIGKVAKRVNTFLEDFTRFATDFTQSVNKIIDDIMSWGKKLFGG